MFHSFWFWTISGAWGTLVYLLVQLYFLLSTGTTDLRIVSSSNAITAFILIGISFLASSLSYFFGFHAGVTYRKYIGITGFSYACMHVILTLLVHEFPRYFLTRYNGYPFFFGLAGILVFLFMTAISNAFATRLIGGRLWRELLRAGYIGFFFAYIHFLFTTIPTIQDWTLTGFKGYPPIGLFVTVFGAIVLLARILLQIELLRKARVPLSEDGKV